MISWYVWVNAIKISKKYNFTKSPSSVTFMDKLNKCNKFCSGYFTIAGGLNDPKQLKILTTKSIDDPMHNYFFF